MLHTTPPITGRLRADIEQLERLHDELAHEIRRPTAWDGTLRRDARIATIVASTSIEGFAVEPETARRIVDGEQPSVDDVADRWAVACYARAMDHVRVMADDPVFEWNHRVLLDLHFDACLFQPTRSPGRYRTGPIHVSAPVGGWAYAAPDADDVVAMTASTMRWLEIEAVGTPVSVSAAMAHLHVVSIHPFHDGNGRAARIVQSLVLARAGILAPEFASIETFLAEHTDEYYRRLQQAQGPTYDPTRDATSWVEFCVHGHLEQGREFQRRVRMTARRWSALEALVESRGWPDRIVVALEQAMADGLARAAYVAESGTSQPTATLDLRRLVDAGLVEPRGAGRSTSYRASDELRHLVAAAEDR